MKAVDIQGIGSALGVSEPWYVQSVTIDNDAEAIDIQLNVKQHKRKFGLFNSNKQSNQGPLIDGSWSHIPIGRYRTIIHAQIPESAINNDDVLNQSLINQFGFLGHPKRSYSNFLRQQFALCQIQDLDACTLTQIYQIDESLTEDIIKDLSNSPDHLKNLAYLPTEYDPIWKNVLLDKKLLQTNSLPLKLLLSKLKLSSIKNSSATTLTNNTLELRKFIVSNVHTLGDEIDQLSGITGDKLKRKFRTINNKQRLILPSLKNPLWMDIITGKLELNSNSLPLNLLIARQGKTFLTAATNDDKIHAISQLRKYFHKNYRTLKTELLLINRVMATQKNNVIQLPDPEHYIWKKILEDNNFVPSNHMAYKLLLARLRMQLSSKLNPVIQVDAATHIRDFITKNQKVMHKDLSFLLKQSNLG